MAACTECASERRPWQGVPRGDSAACDQAGWQARRPACLPELVLLEVHECQVGIGGQGGWVAPLQLVVAQAEVVERRAASGRQGSSGVLLPLGGQ